MAEKKVVVTKRPQYKVYKPHELGWMRRSELGAKTWERPDGKFMCFAKDQPEVVVVRNGKKTAH